MAGSARRPLSIAERTTITTLLEQGKSLQAVGTILGRRKSTIAYAAKAMRSAAAGPRVDKRGRPKALTDREQRTLKRTMDISGFRSVASLTEMVNTTRSQATGGAKKSPVSPSTVRRAVRAMGFASRVAAKKPYLSAKNMAKRLVWSTERRGWSAEWASVLYTDESSFVVRDGSASRVWRRPGERYAPHRLRPTFKSGRQSVMVWGAFSARGRTPLVRVDGTMNADKYTGILEEYIVHQICADFGAPDAAWLQEDLAPCHAAKASKAVKDALGLRVLPWVGQSPDLNPIENAWAELERRLRRRPTAPKSKDELFAALCEEWDAIPASFFKALTESMPRRVRDVIAVKGASTKY